MAYHLIVVLMHIIIFLIKIIIGTQKKRYGCADDVCMCTKTQKNQNEISKQKNAKKYAEQKKKLCIQFFGKTRKLTLFEEHL